MTAEALLNQFKRNALKRNAQGALETVRQYSLMYCMNSNAEPPDANTIAAGIADLYNHDADTLVEMAACLVEDLNYHNLAKIIREGRD